MAATKTEKTIHGIMKSSKIRMPKYHPPSITKPEKEDQMYPIRWPVYDNNDVQKRIENVLGPLSIFAPFPHEDEPEPQDLKLERPVTPVDKEIKSQPSSFDQLAKYIRRRIAAKPDVPYLSFEDQQNLAGIIMGEVNGIWPDIRCQINDPFLTPEENKELNRRIAVHIVTVSEQLFHHYLDKAQVLNERGVFSGPANMSRLKAQLAIEASNFLNILMIRRYIVADMRGQGDVDSADSEDFFPVQQKKPATKRGYAELSYQGLIQTSRPKSKLKKYKLRTLEHDVRDMTSSMPTLDTSKLMDLVSELPERDLSTLSEGDEGPPSRMSETESRMSGVSKENASRQKVLLKRSQSDPVLHAGETLMEELGVSENVRKDPLFNYELEVLHRERISLAKVQVEDVGKPKPGTREYAAEDLKRLIERPEDKETKKVEEDLPPLLQAITRSAKHDDLKERMEKQMKELEEKERQRKETENIPIQDPIHPQPATVSSKLSNQLVVRTSDIRVSERVCMSSITLNRYATVYNDLIEEIDPVTVKALDKNLFLSEEIREVYKEIMKTVPNDHLELDDDPTIVPAADQINLSGTMASSTLAKKSSDRVINPLLHKEQSPPWGEMDAKQWAKTPENPPKNFQGESIFTPMTPNPDKIQENIQNPSKTSQGVTSMENIPSYVADKMARTYASWLQWWKSTVTSDDYMKYLSTQETDYMGVVFHFYDSEDEDGDNAIPGYAQAATRSVHSGKQPEMTEKDKKLQELKAIKTEFKEGFWNVNSVLLGGLGKDPEVIEENADQSKMKSKSADVSQSAKTLSQRAALARQAKMTTEKSRDTSRASKNTRTSSDTRSTNVQEPEKKPLSPQERLEKVWTLLQMPDNLKLDMAIKYSCNEFFSKLSEAIDQWEKAADLIVKRESMIEKLEKFERGASDPNRFFDKGHKRSSVMRLNEARQRSYYYKQIDFLDLEITTELDSIKEKFNDVITFKGRPYAEKMKWDRIEMLYWLQEERKQHAIKYETMTRQLPLKQVQLEPIHTVN